MKFHRKTILLGLTFGIGFWFVDAVVDYLFFIKTRSFWELLVTDIPKHEIYIRLIIFFLFTIFSIILSRYYNKKNRLLAQLRKNEKRLEYRNAIVNNLIKVAKHLLQEEQNYTQIMGIIGKAFKANRAYIFEFDGDLMSNTYEWCAPGTAPQMENLQNLPINTYPWWTKKLEKNEKIIINNIAKMPVEAAAVQDSFKSQNIKSVLVAPIFLEKNLYGFIGFDDTENYRVWTDIEIELIQVVVDLLVMNKKFANAEREIIDNRRTYQEIFNTVSEAIYIQDASGTFIDVNKGAEGMYQLSREELIGLMPNDVSAKGYNDLEKIQQLSEETLASGKTNRFEFWAKRNNGEIFPKDVIVNRGRYFGQEVLITTARDISDRKRTEDVQKNELALIDYAEAHTIEELLKEFLDRTEKLTQSKFSFYQLFSDDTPMVLSTNTNQYFKNNENAMMRLKEGIWPEVLSNKSPVIYNKIPQALQKRMPDTHFLIQRMLLIPIVREKQVVGLLGVANRPTPYTKDDMQAVQRLSDMIWETIKRKNVEKALVRSKNYYQSLFENAHDCILIFRPDNEIILDVNKNACNTYGYSREEFIGMSLKKISFNVERGERQLEETLQNGFFNHFETVQYKKNGEKIFLEINASVIDYNNKPAILSINRDITKRKQSEKALKESEKQYRTLIDNIPGITYRCRADKYWTMIFISDEIETITGYEAADIINNKKLSYKEIIYPADRNHVAHTVNDALKQKKIYYIEYRITHADGSIHWVFEKGQGVFEKKELLYLNGVIIDIDDRKQLEKERQKLEKQLMRSRKLETIGTLAGGIAHDFNNMLTPIMGYSDIILRKISKDNAIYTPVKSILKASKRARQLVQQILTFSRQVESDKKPVVLSEIIDEAVKLLRSSIPSTIKIELDIDNTCPTVHADPAQIHQVIMNLCTNSFQAMEPTGGVLSINLRKMAVDPSLAKIHANLKTGDYLLLSIKDTGVGIKKETIDRIFEPFFTTKEVNQGTGMGLSVVHGIIKNHKGDITVYSEPGKGTVINVYLPTSEQRNESQAVEKKELSKGEETILIVDDDPSVLKMAANVLGILGYKVHQTNKSYDAMLMLKNNPNEYDLLLTDLTMPDMTGLELAREIKANNILTPVIIMTGYGNELDDDKLTDTNIKKVVGKPLAINEFSKIVREALE